MGLAVSIAVLVAHVGGEVDGCPAGPHRHWSRDGVLSEPIAADGPPGPAIFAGQRVIRTIPARGPTSEGRPKT